MTTTQLTLTISGDTYKAREWLKSNGYTWDSDSKSWSRAVVPAVNKMTKAEGFGDLNGNYIGTAAEIAHSVKCYAKSQRVAVSAE